MSTQTVDESTDVIETTPDESPEGTPLDGLPPEKPSGEVVTIKSRNTGGILSIDPNQTKWTPAQVTGLRSIGVETEGPDAIPFSYVWQFLHLCQKADLDPWMREAYLITHGKRSGQNDNRKFTLVTGIDGFRKKAEDTGQYRGQVGPEWLDENGVWHDFWMPKWGPPVAARVGILRTGFDVPVYGVAMYDEYVAMVDEYEGDWNSRRKTGRKVPNSMWEKMPANQIAKCAEAQGFRKTFPRQMAGMYEAAEMSRAQADFDQEQRDQADQAAREKRMIAHAKATSKAPQETVQGEVVEEPAKGAEPTPVGETAQDIVDAITVDEPTEEATAEPDVSPEPAPATGTPAEDDDMVDDYLRAELAWQAKVLGSTVAAITSRAVKAHRKNIEDFTTDERLRTVVTLRPMVVAALRKAERHEDANVYEATPADHATDVGQFDQ